MNLRENKIDSSRIISIDFIRGIAIFGVLFVHPLIYGVWRTEANALEIVPTFVIILLLPIVLAATWGGAFVLISSIVNSYNIYRRLKQGKKFGEATRSILINSTFLILLDPIRSGVFNRTWYNEYGPGLNYSIVSSLLERGKFAWPTAEKIMQIGALPSIGLAGFMTVFFYFIFYKTKQLENIKLNISILSSIAVLISSTYTIFSESMINIISDLFVKGGGYRFLAYILRLFFTAQLSFFPMCIYGFFGIIGGYLLARKEDKKNIKLFGYGFGTLYLVGFIVSTTFTVITSLKSGLDPFEVIFDYRIYPLTLLCISLGIMLMIYPFLVTKIEYADKEKKDQIYRKTLFFRRFGVATLTLYILEPMFNEILATIFHKIFGDTTIPFGEKDAFMYNVYAIILFVITFTLFWIGIVYAWSKIDYKFGFEYWIVKITLPLRKTKTTRFDLIKESLEASKSVQVEKSKNG